jgi:hypothetical protein
MLEFVLVPVFESYLIQFKVIRERLHRHYLFLGRRSDAEVCFENHLVAASLHIDIIKSLLL